MICIVSRIINQLKNYFIAVREWQRAICHKPGQCSPGLWPDHISEQCLIRSFAWMPEAFHFNEDSKLQKEEERESEKN